MHSLLVMPYLSLGSFREFEWHKPQHLDKFKSCLIQLVVSLYISFQYFGFVHSDIHMDNVMLRTTKKDFIQYPFIEDSRNTVATFGMQICIMDFDKSFINCDRNDSSIFYRDIRRIFTEITTTMSLKFSKWNAILNFLTQAESEPSYVASDVFEIVSIIQDISYVTKTEPKILKYDPNVS